MNSHNVYVYASGAQYICFKCLSETKVPKLPLNNNNSK